MSLILCDRCKGKGKFIRLGLLESNCSKCNGMRFVSADKPSDAKTTVKQVLNEANQDPSLTHDNSTEIESRANDILANMNTGARRGRPPKADVVSNDDKVD